jgi:hypothetical protein
VWQALCLTAGTPRTQLYNSICKVTSTRNGQQPSLANTSLTIHYDEKLKNEEMEGTCGTHRSEMFAQSSHLMLPPRSKCDLSLFGILSNVGFYFRTDVSVPTIGIIFKGQAVQKDGTDRLSQNVGTDLPSYVA